MIERLHRPAVSVAAQILLGMILAYRHTVGSVLPKACRFTPSCSTYGLEAIRRHGALRGGWLTVWRVSRCHPLTRGGFDPVPERGAGSKSRTPRGKF